MIHPSRRHHATSTPSLGAAELQQAKRHALRAHIPIQEIYDEVTGKVSVVSASQPLPPASYSSLAWHQKMASYRSRAAITRRIKDCETPNLWAARSHAYERHLARLTPWQSCMWAGKQLLGMLFWPRIAVSYLLFPAKAHKASAMSATVMQQLRKSDIECIPQAIITQDHALLDGTCYRPLQQQHAPGLMLSLPNGASAADVGDWTAALCLAVERPVYVYDYRGVGRSVGALHSTSHAVRDAEAGISRLTPKGSGIRPEDTAVMGISIGAGCAAVAIQNLKSSRHLSATGVGVFTSIHSFASLPATVAGWLGRPAGVATSAALALLRQDPLDAQSAAHRSPLAAHLLVVHAHNDSIIRPRARMALPPTWTDQNSRISSGQAFYDVGAGHVDIDPILNHREIVAALKPAANERE